MFNYKRNDNNDPIVLHCVKCYLDKETCVSAGGQITPPAQYIWEGQSLCEKHVDQIKK